MKERLAFYSLLDFYTKKEEIKNIYKTLTTEEIKVYKKYVYSTCFEREYVKDLMWEYLNDWEPSYERLASEYRKKRRKVKDDIIKNNFDNNYDSFINSKRSKNIRI